MSNKSTSTMCFLFTDIEGSTALLQRAGGKYSELLNRHRAIVRAAIDGHDGTERGTEGDSFFVTFNDPSAAIAAATQAQRDLLAEEWPIDLEVRVRMGIHIGEVEHGDEGPIGLAIHHAARIASAGHGRQIVVSDDMRAAANLVIGTDVLALGIYRVRDVGTIPLFQVSREGLPTDFPSLRVPPEVVGNLPIEISTFVGRVDELQALGAELAAHRLITLIGVGGTGKTRLAIEAAQAASMNYPDGCWLVELAPVTVAEGVPTAFSEGLGVAAPEEGDVIDDLVAQLRDKKLLVIVDNCEHVLAATAAAVERVIAKCPAITILTTSREPLMVRGERLVPVPSLSASDAERLFVERASDEAPDMVVDDAQRAAVAELCKRLDGLPLALELAASRVRSFSPVELVTSLEERFRILVGGRRSRMERHQTMRGTLDWSYNLCEPSDQAVFDRLSVFPAGFDMAAARAIASGDGISDLDVADIVPHLVDRSLLQRTTAPDGTTRFRMLETMRAYGREHLQSQGIADLTRGRHARYIAQQVWAVLQQTMGPDEMRAGQRVDEYLPDAVVAMEWCIEQQEWEDGLRLGWAGSVTMNRESIELRGRLHDAARAAGAAAHLLDEMLLLDYRAANIDEVQRRYGQNWNSFPVHLPIPSDRLVNSPYSDAIVAIEDVDDFVAGLEPWRSAPAYTRFLAEYQAIRALADCAGAETHVDRLMEPFATFVNGLHSNYATQALAELNGFIAAFRGDWPAAVKWYRQVAEAMDGKIEDPVGLSASWHYLAARSLDSLPFMPTGAELRDPWRFCREENWDSLTWHGATSTALALHRLGDDGLADRFIAWAYQSDTSKMESNGFARRLRLANLPTAVIDDAQDLDALINELFAFADTLDA